MAVEAPPDGWSKEVRQQGGSDPVRNQRGATVAFDRRKRRETGYRIEAKQGRRKGDAVEKAR